jgi:UDP-glucose 4-epimerase
MRKILLIGGTGLIGATVYRKLSDSYEVLRLGRRDECEYRADLTKPETLEGFKFKELYAVVHCAGVTDEDFREKTVEAFTQSSVGMDMVVKTAIQNGVKKFVYISTSHVYGMQQGILSEDSPANPLSDYALAHYISEQTLQRKAKNFENVFVLRPNAVFGSPIEIDKFDRWNLIPYSFLLEAAYSQKIILRSSGEQNRNFVGTEDIANYIEAFLLSSTPKQFSIVNPIGEETMSVYEFALKCAEIYKEKTGYNCAIERPNPCVSLSEEPFQYQTQFNFSFEKADLKKASRQLMLKILEEFKNGKKYKA